MFVPLKYGTVPLPDGNVGVLFAVVVKLSVNAPVVCRVEPVTNVKVADVAGAVTVTLFIVLDAVNAPVIVVAGVIVTVLVAFNVAAPAELNDTVNK